MLNSYFGYTYSLLGINIVIDFNQGLANFFYKGPEDIFLSTGHRVSVTITLSLFLESQYGW